MISRFRAFNRVVLCTVSVCGFSNARYLPLAPILFALVSCGGGGVAEPPQPQVLKIEAQAAIAGFELRFDNVAFVLNDLGFGSLGSAVDQRLRINSSTGGGTALLVYLPGTSSMPIKLESKPVPASVAKASGVRTIRCADRSGNLVACNAHWVASS